MTRSPFLMCLMALLSLSVLSACGGGGGGDSVPTPPPPVFFTIETIAAPVEGGDVIGAGTYRSGSSFTLTAVPAPGYVFDRWMENGEELASTASAELFGTADRDRSIVAEFLPVTLELSPEDLTLNINDSAALSATLVADNADPVDVSSAASWFSGNDEVATVNGQGTVTAVAEGTVSISAEFGGQVATTSVRVLPDEISSLTFEPTAVTLAIGDSYTPTLIAHYASGESVSVALDRAVWSSTSASVTVASDGILTAQSAGSSDISAVVDGVTATLTVTVDEALLQTITIEPALSGDGPLLVGEQRDFIARGQYGDGESRDITDRVIWSTPDTGVITVVNNGSEAGRVTAVAAGSASLSASFQDVHAEGVVLQVELDPAAPTAIRLQLLDDVIRWPGEGAALEHGLSALVLNGYGDALAVQRSVIFTVVSGPLSFAGGAAEATSLTENGTASITATATGPGQALVRARVEGTPLTAQARVFVINSIDEVLIGSRSVTTVSTSSGERLRVRFNMINLSGLDVPVVSLRVRAPVFRTDGSFVFETVTLLPGTGAGDLPFDEVPARGVVGQGLLFDIRAASEDITASYTVEDPATGERFTIEL